LQVTIKTREQGGAFPTKIQEELFEKSKIIHLRPSMCFLQRSAGLGTTQSKSRLGMALDYRNKGSELSRKHGNTLIIGTQVAPRAID
jgi:hypothetical protein